MINVLDVTIVSCDPRDSHAWLLLGRTRVASRIWEGMKARRRATVRIRAEDVVLCTGHPGHVSARNVLPGRVRATRSAQGGVAVVLDVGFRLTALVTRAAVKDLKLRRGAAAYAIVKATAVVPYERVGASHRVSLVGARGVLTHQRIDFLRAVARTGSLTAAGREVGVTYRTAWLWAEDASRIWGKPLVSRRHGGKGGGGTVLTSQGFAVLQRAEELEAR
ncbi:MAG: TOBE domain-containing protein [Acidobacteriota bacterium]